MSLIDTIISGNLLESTANIKSILAEKILQKIAEKKKLTPKQKQLDINNNNKLDGDDFKTLRGESTLDEVDYSGKVQYNKVKATKKYQVVDNYGNMISKHDKHSDAVRTALRNANYAVKVVHENTMDEVLDPSTGVKSYIDDFIKSDDPRFVGDTKEQRRKRAIAAFYADKKSK